MVVYGETHIIPVMSLPRRSLLPGVERVRSWRSLASSAMVFCCVLRFPLNVCGGDVLRPRLFAGPSRRLDAFILALSQACGGGEKRWCASTLELHLVSLEFCKACRSVPMLHVRVEDEAPRSLWSPRTIQTQPTVTVGNRLPPTHSVGLTLFLSWVQH